MLEKDAGGKKGLTGGKKGLKKACMQCAKRGKRENRCTVTVLEDFYLVCLIC
jgi:hypothetical protein